IRDFHVTGVQTCALPICTARARRSSCSSGSGARTTAGSRDTGRSTPRSGSARSGSAEGGGMAHKKGVGSSRNGRDSNAQRLGVKDRKSVVEGKGGEIGGR